MNRYLVRYLYNGTLSNKKKQSIETTLMNLKVIIWSERSQAKESTYCMIHLYKIPENEK